MRLVTAIFIGGLMIGCSAEVQEENKTLALVETSTSLAQGGMTGVLGQNGYAHLYTLNKSVPSSMADGVLLEDVRRFILADTYGERESKRLNKHSFFHLDDFPSLGLSDQAYNQLCERKKDLSCLEQIKLRHDDYNKNLDNNRILVQKSLDLNRFDYFASFFPDGLNTPIPDFKPLRYLPTASMVEFSKGGHDKGMNWACQSIQLGYKLLQSSDHLVTNMVGSSMISDGSFVLSEMLVKTPQGTLPLSCQHLLSLSTYNTGNMVCQALRNEKRMVLATMMQAKMPEGGVLIGEPLDVYCQDASIQEMNADVPLSDKWEKLIGSTNERHPEFCKKNKELCLADDHSRPSYYNYGLRIQDSMMYLRMVQQELSSKMGNNLGALKVNKARHIQVHDNTVSFLLYESGDRQRGKIYKQ